MISQKNKQGWRNPWVFGLLAVILSGVLINGKFLWNVFHTPVRILDDHYSVREHNKYDAKWIQEQAERSTLGWQTHLSSSQQLKNDALATKEAAQFILMASPADMVFELKDKDGNPVQDVKVVIDAQWPGDPAFDFKTELQATTPGQYRGSLPFPRAGNWDLVINAVQKDREYKTEQKVYVAIAKP